MKNKCDECGRLAKSVRSKYIDKKIKWICDFCFKRMNKK